MRRSITPEPVNIEPDNNESIASIDIRHVINNNTFFNKIMTYIMTFIIISPIFIIIFRNFYCPNL